MTERDMQSKMTDAQLDTLFKSVAQGIELLHRGASGTTQTPILIVRQKFGCKSVPWLQDTTWASAYRGVNRN